MNANELADELNKNAKEERQDFWSDESGWCDVLEKAATMLRQQQDEIEALKQIIDANNLNQNIGQFVKPTNKPVAWMDYLEHSDVYDLNVSGRGIPLYTHPVKELTDEEIWDFINALCLDMGDYWELTERNAIPMIRAILRKAQEK